MERHTHGWIKANGQLNKGKINHDKTTDEQTGIKIDQQKDREGQMDDRTDRRIDGQKTT